MSLKEQELKKMAALAHLEIDENSIDQLAMDVSAMIHFAEQLHQINTDEATPLTHPLNLLQRLRPDEVTEVNVVNQLDGIAPLFVDDLYLVPNVIEVEK